MAIDLEQVLQQFLATHNVMTLAVNDENGDPWSVPVYYVHKKWQLVWLSSANTTHSRAIMKSPRVSASIFHAQTSWQNIQGIQLSGEARLIGPVPHHPEILRNFAGKHIFMKSAQIAGSPVATAMAKSNWYCLEPKRMVWIDNSVEFGYKEELNL